jgi:4-hydroxy-3-methylbut-2-enyl diphosphate reductase
MTAKIERARELGFCFGVRRAIDIIEKAAKGSSIITLGPIVHNRLVVAKLEELGVHVADELEQARGNTVAVSTHGISPELVEQIRELKLQTIDTTCPNVSSAQKAVKKLADKGFGVIIFGDAAHPEVKGLLGWAGDNAVATMDGNDLAHHKLPLRLGIVSQTTQSSRQFTEFIRTVVESSFPNVKELRVINTLCRETQKRQEAALELARKSDLIIVIGGRNSANTKHLAELCSPEVETYLVETADEIKGDWIKGKQHIGITAGASTPDDSIEEVVARLTALRDGGENN